jgi:hypothetical protein
MDKRITETMASCLTLEKARLVEELKEATTALKATEAQKAILTNSQLPHRVYGALLKHDGLEWVASFGVDDSGQPQLVGRGASPNAALLDFDHKWYGIEKE